MNPLDSDNLAAKRLRACRLGARETLAQIGALAGVHKSTVLRWERGDTSKINHPSLRLLAEHFDVDPAWLLGREEPAFPTAESRTRPVPILGTVRGGVGGVAEEEILGYEPVDASRFGKGEDFFWLRVTGDSMAPVLCEGDLVLIRRQDTVDSGRYAVALVDGEEGLVKQVFHGPGWLELRSVNPYYPPRRFEGEALERVRLLGPVAESRRRYL